MTKYFTWISYFRFNDWNPAVHFQSAAPDLTSQEKEAISESLQQFQLGESSDGKGLIHRVHRYAQRHNIPDLPEAFKCFIREEHRHSDVLGCYLDLEGIPRLSEHWLDSRFRQLRNLAGLELMLTILTTAELIAVPYYTALHNATASPRLRAIARRILDDEAQHLEFQAANFKLLARSRNELLRMATVVCHCLAMTSAVALVYFMYAKTFRKANHSPLAVWSMSFDAYRPIFQQLLGVAPLTSHIRSPSQVHR